MESKMILPKSIFFLFLIVLGPIAVFSDSDSDLAGELLSLQSRSKSGVIHLDDHSISRFLTSPKTPRAYSLLIFFDATRLHDKSELRLTELKAEFSLLAASFIANNKDDSNSRSKLFFCDIEFKESQSSFGLFGVNSLPHVRLVNPNVKSLKESDQMDQGDFSRLAESMAEFVESRTQLTVGPIARPPLLSPNQLMLIGALFLISMPYAVKKVLAGETLIHDQKLWLSGAVFVYFFSVGGTMHNIIRKMPMFMADRNDPNKLVFFYQGSGMQLGAEGFAVGFLYTIVGLLLAFVTHGLVRVRSYHTQRFMMVIALIISFWAVKKVVFLDNWKTGYGIHAFWPSSCQAFAEHYYKLFDTDKGCLSLHHPTSMLTFKGQKFVGIDEIAAKLSQLPFDQCCHLISTVDSQPSSPDGGVVLFVSGSLQLPEEEHLLRFSQMFHLIPSPDGGSFFVHNDIFRLNYC